MSQAASAASGPGFPGVSGRKLTLALLLALFAVGGSLSYLLWTFNQVEIEQRASEQAWYVLADQLDQRYRRLEAALSRQIEARELDEHAGERFRIAIDDFRSTAQPEVQLSAAEEIEAILYTAGEAEAPNAATLEALQSYNQRAVLYDQQLRTPGAAILKRLLRLPALRQFSFPTGPGPAPSQAPEA